MATILHTWGHFVDAAPGRSPQGGSQDPGPRHGGQVSATNAPGPCTHINIDIGARGFPERFISSLGTLEDGAGQVWGVLPPAPYKGRKSHEISNWMGPHMGNKVSVK